MKPFLIGSQLPPDPVLPVEDRITNQGKVSDAMSSGAWMSRKEIQQIAGLPGDAVNTVLFHGIRRGQVERELPSLRGATKAVTQRYRLVAGRRAS